MTQELYRIFSLVFHKPDMQFVRYLRNGFINDLGTLDETTVQVFSRFIKENGEKTDEEFYRTLAVEYTRLFLNAVQGVVCPPYESVYRENSVMGDTTLEVLECYSREGLKVMEKFHDLPDHVAVELEFMYYLTNFGYRDEHDMFMQKHVSQWMPEFCVQVEKNDRIGFYGHAAGALKNFIISEGWKTR